MFDDIYESISLNEGLITSYNIEKLKSTLETSLKDKVEVKLPKKDLHFYDRGFDYKAYSFLMKSSNDENTIKEVQRILNLFGYNISSSEVDEKANIKYYHIEPKFPIKMNKIIEHFKIQDFYHITYDTKVNKILKQGLTPKDSQTRFHHPGNRIYLVAGPMKGVQELLVKLSQDKKVNEKDFRILKIKYNPNADYYLDDVATILSEDIIVVWTLKNIPPSEIKVINL